MPAWPILFTPKQRHFGLSIGRTSFRGVEVDSRGVVKGSAEVILPESIFSKGALVNQQAFVASLKQLVAQGKFTTPYVTVCFSEAHAYSREHTLPIIPVSEVHEAVAWKIKDLFPFAEEDIYFDWKLLEKTETQYRIAIVAVQKQVLDEQLDALISVGLKPLSFEPGAAAVSRLLVFKPGQHALVTEVNRRGAYVTLVEGEKTLFTTVINYTSEDTPQSYLKNIAQTTLDVVAYYKNKGVLQSEAPVVILTGELASEQWARSAQSLVPFAIKMLNTPIHNPAFNKAYAVAVSEVKPPNDIHTINLLPPNIQMFYDQERDQIFYSALLTRVTIFLFFLLVGAVGAFALITLERQRLDARVKTLTASVNSQKPDTQNLLLLNAQAKMIVALAPLRQTVKDKLLVMQNLLPATIAITQWEYDDQKLQFMITGDAQDRADLVAFKNKLEESEEFTRVSLPLGSLESPKNVHFALTFVLKK
jgi:Tfp pilus assembly PilM family ATPase